MTKRTVTALSFFVFAVYGPLARAQPRFDVASVRLGDPKTPGSGMEITPGGRFSSDMPLRYVIERVYKIEDYQLLGGPDWLKSERYAIQAEAAGPATEDQVKLMVQALLTDRFHLKVHRETKRLPVYALVVGKNGPKLDTARDAAPCGGGGCFGIGRGSFTARGATMESTANVLNRILDRPVIDETHLAGNYDFKLHFDPSTASSPVMGAVSAPDSTEPSIFTAIQEQIGLKFEPRNQPVEILVIDHIERPTEN